MAKYDLLIKLDTTMDPEIVDYYKNYKPKYEEDSGFDLPAPLDVVIFQKPCGSIDFKISAAMIKRETNELCGYYLYPRSSISKYPLMAANHVGIIDSGYRGEIKGKVRFLPFATEEINFTVTKGTKLFQICAPDLSPFKVKIVNSLPDSERGSNGFGSTGN